MTRSEDLQACMGTDEWWSVNQVAWEWRFPVASVRSCFAANGPDVLERKRCETTGRTLYRWRDKAPCGCLPGCLCTDCAWCRLKREQVAA